MPGERRVITMRLTEAQEAVNGALSGADRAFAGCNIDSRSIKAGELFVALRGSRHDGHDFIDAAFEKGAAAVMADRDAGDSRPLLKVKDTRQALGMLAARWRDKFTLPVVAVTGSNGKTTVKEMINAILSEDAEVLATWGNLNNDIGAPLTLFRLNQRHGFAVVEMGANHPGEIRWLSRLARPTVALITQCAPAHLEGFGSVAGVARAKAEIYEGLAPDGAAVINRDDNYADLWWDAAKANRRLAFGLDENAAVTAVDVNADPERGQTRFTLRFNGAETDIKLGLLGRHNVLNALAAAACCLALNVPLPRIKAGLEKTRAVKGRLQPKQGLKGARLFDDAYNANPASLEAALETLRGLSGGAWLALGDMGELGEGAAGFHRQAGERARAAGIQRLYGLGPLARQAVDGFGAGARHFDRMDDLIETLRRDLTPGVNLLVKGSRAMAMERAVEALTEQD